VRQKNSIAIGHAGEHLTCYVAIMDGYNAYRVTGQLPYDVIVEKGKNLYKVQVKTSTYKGNRPSITFQLRRRAMSYSSKKSTAYSYPKNTIDLYAFASPDYNKVAFIPMEDIVNQYKISINKEDFNKYPLNIALEKIDV
tara:strand:- start:477 stop:893 length:417 start_codon:yes stop_codon:yes gene_type:complete